MLISLIAIIVPKADVFPSPLSQADPVFRTLVLLLGTFLTGANGSTGTARHNRGGSATAREVQPQPVRFSHSQ